MCFGPSVSSRKLTEGADYYKKKSCDGVIAFGGGSGLDVGKAMINLIILKIQLKRSDNIAYSCSNYRNFK